MSWKIMCGGRDLGLLHRYGNTASMTGENWHEERDRLMRLLEAIEAGKITHIDVDDQRELRQTNPEDVLLLEMRVAQLNARLSKD